MSVRRVMALVGLAGLLAGSGVASGAASGGDNGVAVKSASDIVLSSRSAINSVRTVHVFGYVLSGSKLTLDLNLVTDRGGEGTMSSNGLKFSLLVIGKTAYVRAGAAYWTAFGGGAAARQLAGKWIRLPRTREFAALFKLTDVHLLFSTLLRSNGQLTKGGRSTVNGQGVIAVNDSGGGTLYVATTGEPYPILFSRSGQSGGRVTFNRFNETVTLTAPRHALKLTKRGKHT